ncbi:16S rRNA (uracil(1498)-N(3))-methyltransferase [Amphritea opalescens]|uniref:Ribosomal RNA small subunit methyltransferase E n=1 Tax=Amphritea opalescens TaxID=2490544 RepID=A0A430KUM1_9GAMM|nr:16S rRNA (uracil(1498)-N(3))-methyltransferase [Amphritea opalescens]RTE67199.1 16S rRNA (uracil(1498)-N(3))-methyltransferase [Amphritea opalescens]
MRIPRFYEPQAIIEGQPLSLSDSVVQHVSRALRMRPGDTLILFNGDGCEYTAELTEVAKRSASVQITQTVKPQRVSPLTITLGQSISRGERMDYAVQKATELGMNRMVPLFTERCEVRLNNDRQDKRRQHWQQVAVSACEQSLRCDLPEIGEPQSLNDWLDNVEADLKLVLHHHTEQPLGDFAKPDSIALLIGPEGGLSEAEVELALAKGFKPVAFGPRVFRTETAPVAALSVLQYLWGDLG